jgi:pyruvate dehydrogenase E2 component (dihydrolipoamide acetyltransferase)
LPLKEAPLSGQRVITREIAVADGVFAPGHLGELTQIVPFEMVDAVLADCGATQRRLRKLPARVVVYLLLAAALFEECGYLAVWAKLTAALGPLRLPSITATALWHARARLAAEFGVDLGTVEGTGPGGAVRAADVRRAASAGAPAAWQPAARPPTAAAAPAWQAVPASQAAQADRARRAQSMRQAIARLMARSKREIPHYYVSNTVDMGAALAWLRERNRSLGVSQRLVPAALLLRATALAARQIPELNGYWTEEHFVPGEAVHLGVAISLRGGGLITPAIHHADGLDPGELMARLRDLVNRARAGRLRRPELTDATITVTNLGDQGVESVTGVIYPPQVALVGFGKITERPWAVGGLLGIRPVVATTLAADHRATDGYTGGRFLAVVADLLQRPEEL